MVAFCTISIISLFDIKPKFSFTLSMNEPIYPLSLKTCIFHLLTVKRAHESVSEAIVFNPTATTFNYGIWFCAGHLISWSISFLVWKVAYVLRDVEKSPWNKHMKAQLFGMRQNIWSFPSSFCFSFIFFPTLEKILVIEWQTFEESDVCLSHFPFKHHNCCFTYTFPSNH